MIHIPINKIAFIRTLGAKRKGSCVILDNRVKIRVSAKSAFEIIQALKKRGPVFSCHPCIDRILSAEKKEKLRQQMKLNHEMKPSVFRKPSKRSLTGLQ